MGNKILVTGGNGFLGKHLVSQLIEGGVSPTDVICFSRSGDAALEAAGVTMTSGSVTDREALAAAAKDCRVVYHLAGRVDRSPDALGGLMKVHVQGTRNVLHAAAQAGAGRVVYVSTSGTIGVSKHADDIATEDDPYPMELVRTWPYYLSKIYAEQTANEVSGETGIDLVTLNPTLLLGPGDERNSSTGDVLKFLRRQIPSVPSGGMSFVDVRDAAAATIAAGDKGRPGQRYLVTAANWPVEQFLRRLESISGVKAPVLKVPDRPARWVGRLLEWGYDIAGREAPLDRITVEMSQHFWYVDASRAQRDLGFAPREPNATLQDTVDDLRARYKLD